MIIEISKIKIKTHNETFLFLPDAGKSTIGGHVM